MLLVYQGRPLPPIFKGLSRVFFNDAKCFVVQQPCAAQQNGRTWQEFLDKKRCLPNKVGACFWNNLWLLHRQCGCCKCAWKWGNPGYPRLATWITSIGKKMMNHRTWVTQLIPFQTKPYAKYIICQAFLAKLHSLKSCQKNSQGEELDSEKSRLHTSLETLEHQQRKLRVRQRMTEKLQEIEWFFWKGPTMKVMKGPPVAGCNWGTLHGIGSWFSGDWEYVSHCGGVDPVAHPVAHPGVVGCSGAAVYFQSPTMQLVLLRHKTRSARVTMASVTFAEPGRASKREE